MRLKAKLKELRRLVIRTVVRSIARPVTVSSASALVIAPHPDDETFGCGGLIALKRSQGSAVHVVFLSRGEGAHRNCCGTSEALIGDVRKQQAEQSCAMLGVLRENLHWLELPDGGIPDGDNVDVETVNKLGDLIRTSSPAEVYAPVPFDCWPDHECAFDLIRSVFVKHGADCTLYGYSVWMWYTLRIRDLLRLKKWRALRLDIRSVQKVKQSATQLYLGAIKPSCGIPYCGNLPSGFLRPFQRDYEIYFQSYDGDRFE